MSMDRVYFDASVAREFPRFSVYTRAVSGDPWVERRMLDKWPRTTDAGGLPEFQDTRRRPGCMVRQVSRVLLPATGTATIVVPYGEIDGQAYDLDAAEWDWRQHQIKIDCINDAGDWETVFWGTVEAMEDTEPPGWQGSELSTPIVRAGMRVYRCVDLTIGLARTFYDRHWYQDDQAAPEIIVTGPASFNVDRAGAYSPNRGAAGGAAPSGAFAHRFPGEYNAVPWTEADAVRTLLAIASVQGIVQPITLVDGSGLLQSQASLAVDAPAPILDCINRICRRDRGRGSAHLDWTDSLVGQSTGAVLRILPQLTESLSVGGKTYQGAAAAGTTQEIPLTGDHRVDAASFVLSSADDNRVDAVETIGERIQVGISLQKGKGLRIGWQESVATEWDAIAPEEWDLADAAKYDAVYRVLQIEQDTPLRTDAALRYDYTCDDFTSVANPTGAPRCAPGDCVLLPYFPCPASRDPATAVAAGGAGASDASVLPAAVYTLDDDKLWQYGDTALKITPHAIRLDYLGDGGTYRAGKDRHDKEVIVCGVELPSRLRRRTVRANVANPVRVQQIFVNGAHLWLGHRGAIVGVDAAFAPKTIRSSAPVVYRDDSLRLYGVHELAAAWMLQDRRSLRYTYRSACALVAEFLDGDAAVDGPKPYPRLGHVITTAYVGGEAASVNCVVSAIEYDNGNTTITTDWKRLAI